jgi:hypothetical protein
MIYSPANPNVVFFRPTDGSGYTAHDLFVEFSDAVPQVQGEVVAVHPDNTKIRVGDWIFFKEHVPEIVKCVGGKYYTIRDPHIYMLIRADDEQTTTEIS